MKAKKQNANQTSTTIPLRKRKDRSKRWRFFRKVDWSRFHYPAVNRWLALVFLSALLAVIISYRVSLRPDVEFRVGQVAAVDIKAPDDFLVEDGPATLEKINKASEKVLPVYDFDLNMLTEVERKAENALREMRKHSSPEDGAATVEGKPTREELSELLGFEVSRSTFSALEKNSFDPVVLNYVYRILTPLFEQGVVSNRELLMAEQHRGVTVRYFPTREETGVFDFSRILDLDQARSKIKKAVRLELSSSDRSLENPVIELARGFVRPNLTFNKSETEERKLAARAEVKPVLFEVKKGEIILREGEKVTTAHLLKLNKLEELKNGRDPFSYTWGNFVIVFLAIALAFTYPLSDDPKNQHAWYKDLLFMGIMLILITLMVQVSTSFSHRDVQLFTKESLFFALPIATGALVISVVLGMRHASVFAVLVSIFAAMIGGYRLEHVIYLLIGSLVGAREALGSRQRSTLFRAGVWVGVMNSILILCFSVKAGLFAEWKPMVGDMVIGFASGFVSGIIATGLVPFIEVLFSYTTDIKLLELSNLNHPLLRDLIVRAPGTYHHSIVTGSLVEAAAEAINANPLMARVGAYYHDIGKMRKPIYFIENQKGIENKHDKLSPNMSSLILISHVKEGVQKAREYKLGRVIKDIIKQHHGTGLITYFFQRAKEKERESHADYEVDEKNFRYPGPKPQTKEAGLVMLADAVEAAARTLTDPTPARIQGMVQKIITNLFADGQLDECPITLNDLHLIAKSFNRILTGMFHHRIEYPERHESVDKESPKEAAGRHKNGQEDRDRDLKRLGIS